MIGACALSLGFELVLDRQPDEIGADYWTAQTLTTEQFVRHLAVSPEGRGALWSSAPAALGPLAEAIDIACGQPQPVDNLSGWVDGGNGVNMPAVMLRVRGCESSGNPNAPGNYSATNPRSSAAGAWQFLTGTWQWITDRSDTALNASPAEQDQAALKLLEASGGDPGSSQAWAASKGCWG